MAASAGNFGVLMLKSLVLALALAAPGVAAQAPIDLGSVRLAVHVSRTAQVFHIVDQLADWDIRTHRSYVRWGTDSLVLDSTDRAVLAKHAALRTARGWGRGFEESFYTTGDISVAARAATARGLISSRESRAEAEILAHFERRLSPLLSVSAARVDTFASRLLLIPDSLQSALLPVIRLAGVTRPVEIPVYLVPNPMTGSRGGRYAGRRVIVEVPARPDPLPSLYHELFHALMSRHETRVRAAAARGGVEFDLFSEALAYAYSPGLTSTGPDVLQRQIDNSAADSPLRHTLSLALLLRPLLRDALEHNEPLPTFLSHAGALLRGSALF